MPGTDPYWRDKELFVAALDKPLDERGAFLRDACRDDPALLERVSQLLAAHDSAGGMPSRPTAFVPPQFDPAGIVAGEPPGDIIGPYKILQLIGEGGFGTVYMAEQESPVRRRVALKVIKLGMDTRQVVARFEAERQALAMMDHAGIAKVFDAGSTQAGRPYFVMELVNGVPITEYCDRQNLRISQRLELFIQVCQAVQHAHQKGIIHRDLKPTNVLVSVQDDRPIARVIDFGIAKATQASLTEKTAFTEFRQLIGTPEYMSPEQAESSLDIDTRSDVYSLGVLLYELLTGTTPFDARELRSKAYAEIQRIIREVEPPRPSTRLQRNTDTIAGMAAHRQTDPRKLTASVRGELDWIVMKCLEKDRARRYESAASLAGDILHYLTDEPVSAAGPSQVYRLRKFIRRNKGPVLAAATIFLVLVAGIIGTTIGMIGQARQRREAQRQEAEAKNQAAIAEAVMSFHEDMLQSAAPYKRLGNDKITVVEAMNAAAKELDAGKLKDQPEVEVRVRYSVGDTLRRLGRYDVAEPQLRRAVDLCRKTFPSPNRRTAMSLQLLGGLLDEQGKYAEAESLYRESLQIIQGLPVADHLYVANVMTDLAQLLQKEGKLDEAEALHREALDQRRQVIPAGDLRLAPSVNNLATVVFMRGKYAEAERLFRESLAGNRQHLPPGSQEIANGLSNLSTTLEAQGRPAEAEPLIREAVEIIRRFFPAGHPGIAGMVENHGKVLGTLQKYDEAEALLREALEINRKALPPGHPSIGRVLNNLASILSGEGRSADAEPLAREALDICRNAFPAEHPAVASTLSTLAGVLEAQGKLPEAEPLLREAVQINRKSLPPRHPNTALTLHYLATVMCDRGKFAEAESPSREAVVAFEAAFGKASPERARAQVTLGRILTGLSRYAEAEAALQEAERTLSATTEESSHRPHRCIEGLIALYNAWDQSEPGKGFDAKAAHWTAKLATTPPPATSPR